jgi:hypothetical protein
MAGADHLSITNNQLLRLVPNSNDPGVGAMSGAYGILLGPTVTDGASVQAGYVEILGNVIKDFATDSTQQTVGSASRFAIAMQGYNSVVIADNHLINIGPAADNVDTSAGIYAAGYFFDRIAVTGNVIRRNDSGTVGDTGTQWYGLFISGFNLDRGPTEGGGRLLNQKTVRTSDTQFVGVSEFGGSLVNAGGLQNVSVGGNYIEAAGSVAPILIDIGGQCIFTGNQCSLTPADQDEDTPIASLKAEGVIASNNVLQCAGKKGPGLIIETESTAPNNFTVLGNIVSGTIEANGPLNATLAALNVSD